MEGEENKLMNVWLANGSFEVKLLRSPSIERRHMKTVIKIELDGPIRFTLSSH